MNNRIKFNILILILLVLSLSSIVTATRYVNYDIKKGVISSSGVFTATDEAVTNANAIGFVCSSSGCGSVSGTLWDGQAQNSGGTNGLQLTYPTTLQSQYGYGVYYYKSGYITWESNPNWWGTYSGDPQGPYNVYLSKKQDCYSPIDTFSVTNDAQANIPLVVNVSGSLDATTYAALRNSGPLAYTPPSLADDYYSVATRVTLTVYDSAGNVVNQQTQDIVIPASGSYRVEFTWTPTLDGQYTAKVATAVTDEKCSSYIEQSSSKEFTVIPEQPRNMCYTILNNLATSDQFPTDGETITITATKISNYADNNYNLIPVQTNVNLRVTRVADGQIVNQQSKTISANVNNYDTVLFSFDWPINSGQGNHNITIDGLASSPYCNGLQNLQDIASEIIYVNAKPNEAPTIANLPDVSFNEDSTPPVNLIDLWQYASDPETDASQLTYHVVSQSNPSLVNCFVNNNRYVNCGQPALNQYGNSAVTVEVSDGQYSDRDTFIVTVNAVNDAPTISGIPDQNFNEDSGLNDNILDLWTYASDAETAPSGLVYTIIAETNTAVVDCTVDTNRYIDCTTQANQNGNSDVTIQVSDGSLTSTDTLRVTVNSVNDAPAWATSIADANQNEDFGTITHVNDLSTYVTDADGDAITFSVAAENTAEVDCQVTGNQLTLNSVANWNGAASCTIRANDGNGGIADDTFSITVNAVNDAPTISGIPDQNFNEDSGLNDNILDLWTYASDAETAPSGLVYTIIAETNTAVVDCTVDTNRYIDCTTQANQNGNSDVTIQVSDGSLTSTDTLRVTVNSVNDAPAWATSIADANQNEDFGTITHVNDLSTYVTDADGDAITFSVAAENTAEVDCQVTGNQLTLNSVANWNGAASCTIRANDGNGGIADDTFSINVNPISDNPTVTITAPTEGETISGTYAITWAATDPDQSSSTLDIMIQYRYNGTSWITLEDAMDNNDGSFTWDTTTVSDANDYSLRITVTDDALNTATDTITQFVIDNPQAPNAAITAPSVGEIINGIYPVTWTATDLDQSSSTLDILLQYRCCGNTAWTTLENGIDNNDGSFTWNTSTVPNSNDYELRVIATDDASLTGTGYVSQFTIGPNSPMVNITAPTDGETINGIYTITWAASGPDQAVNTLDVLIEYRYNGTNWINLFSSTNNPSSYVWDTTTLSDANDYRLRITVTDDNGQTGIDTIDQFMVDNPSAPNVAIIQPLQGAIWSGVRNVSWTATDLEQASSTLDILLQYRCCGNTGWTNLINSTNNLGLYSWNTSTVQNSNDYELRVIATDDTSLTGTGYVIQFSISNIIILPPPVVQPKPQNKVHIDKISIGGDSVKAGDDLVIAIDFENSGELDLDDVSATAVIQELGIRKKIGPFDLDRNDDTARTIVLEIPEYAESGRYDVRITINNDKIRRVRHRPVIIK